MPKVHVVQKGEWLQKIAEDEGFASWRTIYDDPANADFRKKRPNPNLIFPGDEVVIPGSVGTKTVPLTPGRDHRIVIQTGEPDVLRVEARDASGAALAGKDFELAVGERTITGTVPDDGVVEQELAPGEAGSARLTVWIDADHTQGMQWDLAIGHLDPVEETSGLKARLNNLRFFCGEVNDVFDATTATAVRLFQREHGLTPDGEANDETRAKLVEVYGY